MTNDDQSFDGMCPTCGQTYHGSDQAELTRWRAMFSTPEIASRNIDRINASCEHIQAKLAEMEADREAPLEFDATVARLIAVAKAHGWTLRSWGLTRIHPEDEG